MRIIIEGPDGAGKTTLAKKLSEAFGYPIKHFSFPKTKLEREHLFDEYRSFLSANDNVIIDRMWYSTQVYGPVMRAHSEISEQAALELERLYTPLVIYCTGNPILLWERCKERGEDYVENPDQFLKICEAYDDLMLNKKHNVPIFTFDTTKEVKNG